MDKGQMSKAPRPVALSFGQFVSVRGRCEDLTPDIYAWAEKKFGRGIGVWMTAYERAKSRGQIEIVKPKGRMGSRTITVTRHGNYLMVRDNQGGGMTKPTTKYFELR